jgi:hypothetical protein
LTFSSRYRDWCTWTTIRRHPGYSRRPPGHSRWPCHWGRRCSRWPCHWGHRYSRWPCHWGRRYSRWPCHWGRRYSRWPCHWGRRYSRWCGWWIGLIARSDLITCYVWRLIIRCSRIYLHVSSICLPHHFYLHLHKSCTVAVLSAFTITANQRSAFSCELLNTKH